MSSRSLRNIDNATLNREVYSNHLNQVRIDNLGEFNSLQEQVNMLYASIDLSGGGSGPVQDIINAINEISAEVETLQASQAATTAGLAETQQNILDINMLYGQVDAANTDNVFLDASNATVNADKTFQNGLAVSTTTAGFIRNAANGTLTAAGLLGNIDISPTANISDVKLATITTAGKVSNNALSTTSEQMPGRIASRDASGNVLVLRQPPGTNNYKVATNGFVILEFNRVIDNASATLDTLGELANALGNDPNFAGNVSAALATKAPLVDASFSGNCVVAANVIVSSLNVSGIIRNDENGNLYSSQLTLADVSGLLFYDSNLQPITTAGKVAASATSATYTSAPNSIVLRDASGIVFANNVISNMYSTIRDKDVSWNTWGYYPLSKSRATVRTITSRYGGQISTGISAGAWSPELKIFVSTSRNATPAGKIGYSTNLIDFTPLTIPDIYTYNEICWSRELGIFVAIGNNVLYSSNGIDWSKIGVVLPNTNTWKSLCWSPELGMFVAVCNTGSTNRAMRSFDGKIWESAITNTDAWNSVCWSAELGIFVAVSTTNNSAWSMWSSNGLQWNVNTGLPVAAVNTVVWVAEFGRFFAGTSTMMYSSTDGKTWSIHTSSFTGQTGTLYRFTWARELKVFLATFSNSNCYSYNGIHWISTDDGLTAQPEYTPVFIPEYGLVVGALSVITPFHNGYPTTQNLFNGTNANTREDGTQYFGQIYFNTDLSASRVLNTYGITNTTTLTSSQNVVNTALRYTPLASQNKVMTCIRTEATANAGWMVPVGTRIDATISTDSNSLWTASNTIVRIATMTLPFGVWMVYYKVSLRPTDGTNTVATQLIAGISATSQSLSFVEGSGSRYKDDFQRALTPSRYTSYLPRTCRLIVSSTAGTLYYLNAQLTFTASIAPTNIRANSESYMYAIKIQ